MLTPYNNGCDCCGMDWMVAPEIYIGPWQLLSQ
jgi:hypothetical protein